MHSYLHKRLQKFYRGSTARFKTQAKRSWCLSLASKLQMQVGILTALEIKATSWSHTSELGKATTALQDSF
jgi:hypothetical protein